MSNNTVIINDTTPRVQYAAAGGVTDFSFDFTIFDKDDLRVWLDDDLQTSGYSVVLDEDKTGRVAFDAAPEAGTLVTLVRDMAYDQHADFTAVGNLRREVLHNELSRIFAMIQQVAYKIAKTVAVSDVSNSDPSQIVGKIEVLYDDRDKLITVAEHIAAVDVCADSIEAVKDAPNQAAAAAASAQTAASCAAGAHIDANAAEVAAASAADSRDKAAASENKAREYALQAVRRNVGDVFYTSRTDAALNGAVPVNGSIYNVSDFSGEADVPALLEAGKLPYISMADYAERLAEHELNYAYYQGVLHNDGTFTSNPYGRVVPNFNPDYQQYGSWEFRTKFCYINRGGTGYRYILGTDSSTDYKGPILGISSAGALICFLTSNGTSWNIANAVSVGKTLTADVWYDLAFGFDGSQYYFRWKEASQSDEEWTTSWTLANTTKALSAAPMMLMSHRITADLTLGFWNGGFMNLPETRFAADGVELWRGKAPIVEQKSCSVFGWDGAGSTTFRVPLAEKPKRVLVAKKEPTSEADQTWWNLYSDGWLEQGDMVWNQAVAVTTPQGYVTLPRAFRDTNYTVMTVSEGGVGDYLYSGVGVYPKNKDSFCFAHRWYGRYVACGYANVPTEAEYQFQNIEAQRAMVQVATGNTDNALVTATTVLSRMNRLEERFQIVSALPENPDAETFYFVVNQGG